MPTPRALTFANLAQGLFDRTLEGIQPQPLQRDRLTTLQINVGKLCNQACLHCHVEAGPKRTEIMSEAVASRLIELMQRAQHLDTLDITGGAPELNPHFRTLVRAGRDLGLHVMDRCNLTIFFEPGQDDLIDFLAQHRVEIVASLPCYTAGNVDEQRGKGVFDKSIQALRLLNQAGYGQPDSGLLLNLVYNPVGAHLPPAQAKLQADYKRELHEHFGIVFNQLFTITNMPISRFAHFLQRSGQYQRYMELLVQSFNPATLEGLMCRYLISVGYDGQIYDCDFNQMLEFNVPHPGATNIFALDTLDTLAQTRIATANHCFGCTAGAGSSCSGALG